ncbi:MAG: pilus assembly protein PilM [Peptostreptococcales bacterium]
MKNSLYIELNADRIKLLYRSKKSHQFIVDMPENAYEDGKINHVKKIAETLSNSIKKLKIRPNECSFCINSSRVIIKQFAISSLDNKEQESLAIQEGIAEVISENLDIYSMSYKLHGEENGLLKGTAVLFPKDLLRGYQAVARRLKMDIGVVDVSQNCAIKYYRRIEENKNAILIDLNYHYINVTLMNNYHFCLNKFLTKGFNFVEYYLWKEMDLAQRQESDIMHYLEGNWNITKACIRESVKELELTIQQFIEYTRNNNQGEEVQEIFLYGDYADINLLVAIMKDLTDIPIGMCNEKNIFHVNVIGCSVRE